MAAKIRPARGGKGWEYDILFRWPEGERFRERANAPVASKSAALRWAQAREAALLAAGRDAHERKNLVDVRVPTLGDFWPRFVEDHYRASRKKPSTIDAAGTIYNVHLQELATKRLDAISTADVAALKGRLKKRKPKTVNNVLSVLSRCLGAAVEWELIPSMPCKIELLPTQQPKMDWYEREAYLRLVEAAAKISTGHLVLVLLAGSGGLRRGEIIALKWSDLDMPRKAIAVERAMWRKHEESPKGGRGRPLPMTAELAAALTAHRHIRGERVLYSDKGRVMSNRSIRNWLAQAQRRAGLEANGGIHMLRHTFCSHLAIAGVSAKAIQELAGHADLKTTQRYMHLSPGNRSDAMDALARYHAEDAKADRSGDSGVPHKLRDRAAS
jgi:integrase